MGEFETTAAAPFIHMRISALSQMKLIFYYTQDKRWMGIDDAKKLIAQALARGCYLKDEKGEFTLADALKSEKIPLGFKPTDAIFAEDDIPEINPIEGTVTFTNGEVLEVATISSAILLEVYLSSRFLIEDKYDALWAEVQWQNNITKEILSHSPINVEVSNISKEEFEKYPPYYSFDLCDKSYSIEYTYEEYLEHMELTEAYANDNENYMFIKDNNAPFRNIQIRIKENSWAIISKRTSPTIHFVIHHPKLVSAIWNFIPIED